MLLVSIAKSDFFPNIFEIELSFSWRAAILSILYSYILILSYNY